MPNHTSTLLEIKGSSKVIKQLIEAVTQPKKGKEEGSNFSCERIRPMPPELMRVASPVQIVSQKEYDAHQLKQPSKGLDCGGPITKKIAANYQKRFGATNWYDWAIQNWGTKWGTYDVGDWVITKSSARIFFMSAWSPCSPVIEELSRRFPSLQMKLSFADEGGGFLGYQTFANGGMEEDVDIEWNSGAGKRLRRELGSGDFSEDEN